LSPPRQIDWKHANANVSGLVPAVPTQQINVADWVDFTGVEKKNGQTATYEPIRPKPKQTESSTWCAIQ